MGKYPIRYVAREVLANGKVVAYFVSQAYLFEEIKTYNANGEIKKRYEIDFITRIYDEDYEVENGENYKRYYKKDRVDTDLEQCVDYVRSLNYQLWAEVCKGFTIDNCKDLTVEKLKQKKEELDKLKRKKEEYEKYFKFAQEMQKKCLHKELNNENAK